MAQPDPEPPRAAGVEEDTPELTQIEGARLLATHSRPRLKEQGFTDSQIEKWAEAFVREEGAGDVEGFILWVAEQQNS